jgi:hypothetical protein
MSRKRMLAVVALTGFVVMTGCASGARVHKPGTVQHVVLCWLKDRGDAAARDRIIAASKTFTQIPGVLSVSAGVVLPSDRPIVDSTFDVGIIVTCADADAMRAYLVHPIHTAAAQDILQPCVKKVVVYDFTE